MPKTKVFSGKLQGHVEKKLATENTEKALFSGLCVLCALCGYSLPRFSF